ncbi:MAG TPA: HPr family phosphocarrier protein [Mobilitalea sp.]|nr:HPr family phosphocarrier protein [Mobilitalea sp.]
MKSFEYTIQDALGIHARPAGLLVKISKNYESSITITKQGATVDAKKLMALMGLGVMKGATVTVKTEGSDEEAAIKALEEFFKANL